MLAEKQDMVGGNQDPVVNRSSKKTRAVSADLEMAVPKRRPEDLTPRELEILHLIWDGRYQSQHCGTFEYQHEDRRYPSGQYDEEAAGLKYRSTIESGIRGKTAAYQRWDWAA